MTPQGARALRKEHARAPHQQRACALRQQCINPLQQERAFTLIEVLVALLVFSILGFAVTSRVGDIINQTYIIERRTVAHWVTDNYLARLRIAGRQTNDVLPTGRSQERVLMGDREWRLEIEVLGTEHPWFRRVEVETFEVVDDQPIGPIDQMVAFVGRY